jgi:C4-dicarboxylate-specific signal transduction histidine kinase
MHARTPFRNLPIRSKLTVLLLVPSAVVLCLCAVVLSAVQMVSFRQNFERDLVSAAEIVAANVTAAVAFNDAQAAAEILRGLQTKRQVISARLVGQSGKTFVWFGQTNAEPVGEWPTTNRVEIREGLAFVTQPVLLDGRPIAALQVVSDYQDARAGLFEAVVGLITMVTGVVVVVVVALSRRLQRLVSDPVQHLSDTARRVMEANDYSVRAQELAGAELGLLARTFNQMLAHIQKQDVALHQASRDLARQVEELQREVEERQRAERKSQELHKELVTASRQAGMAEVATDVLHNVGNVLNSLNVSTEIINDRLARMQSDGVRRVAELLRQHAQDLGPFLTADPKGRLVPEFLGNLGTHLDEERAEMTREMTQLTRNVGHIKEIVEMQQSYARMLGLVEDLQVEELVEDAISLNSGAFHRHRVELRRAFQPVPRVRVDKHKVLQILVNLLRNAKYALDETNRPDRLISVQVQPGAPDRVQVVVQDNGAGIPPENLTRIFQHGFTTRRNGHGFGLHSGALAAQEMGGKLSAASDGPGRGATFTLELPAAPIRGEDHVTAN